MNTAELRKLRFFEALRFVLALAACLAVLAWASCCAGCAAPGELPPGAIDFVTNSVQRAITAAEKAAEEYSRREDGEGRTEDPATTPSAGQRGEDGEGAQGSSGSPSSPGSPVLDFRYGGFDGLKAVEDPRCRLALVSITKDRIAYKWASGIPSDWKRGKTSKGMMVVACAFYRDGEKWVGGKMDWTDEARTVREATHIHDGYNGWQSAGWDSASRRAFCVVSADGRHRSNLLEETR